MRASDVALRRVGVTGLLLSPWAIAALVATAAMAISPIIALAGFGCVSVAALREFRVPPWLYLAVPLQFGFVAAGAWPLATLCLPLAATLAVPLATVIARDAAGLEASVALRCWAVLFAVYALSHAPALAMLPDAAFARLTGAAIVGLGLLGLLAGAAGARVAVAMGLRPLEWVAAVAFPAPVLFHLVRSA